MKLWEEYKERAERAEKELLNVRELYESRWKELRLETNVASHRAEQKTFTTINFDRRQAWKISQVLIRQLSDENEKEIQVEFFSEV